MFASDETTRYFITLGLLFLLPLAYWMLTRRRRRHSSSSLSMGISGKGVLWILLICLGVGIGAAIYMQTVQPQRCEDYCRSIGNSHFDYKPSKWYVLPGICACYKEGTNKPNSSQKVK